MLVLVDESGDTGFKTGSSRYFVITMVVFEERQEGGRYLSAEHAAEVIKGIKVAVKHVPEFHFTCCSHTVRKSFFNGLNTEKCQFSVYSLVVDKELITSHHLKSRPQAFYNFVLKLLLSHNPIKGATIKLDGQKNKKLARAMESYLRQGQDGMMRKLKLVDSKKDVLVQLADMACGAIAYERKQKDVLNAKEYRIRLGKRVKNIWEFK